MDTETKPQRSLPETRSRNQSRLSKFDEQSVRRKFRHEFRRGRSQSDAFTNVRRKIGQRPVPPHLVEQWLQEFSTSIGGSFNLGSNYPYAKQMLLLSVDEQQRRRNEIARWPSANMQNMVFITERYSISVNFEGTKMTAIVLHDNFHRKQK